MSRTGRGFVAAWDAEWEPVSGCSHASPGCRNCYAERLAGTLHQQSGSKREVTPLYADITKTVKGRPRFNGVLKTQPPGHTSWTELLRHRGIRHRGVRHPVLGRGKPRLVFIGSMADLLHEDRPRADIDDVIETITLSEHIGLVLSRRSHIMADYFRGKPADVQRQWKRKLLLGFSAENQKYFDKRWNDIRALADDGWRTVCFVTPMIGPVSLPPDFLAYGNRTWVICGGEQGKDARPMNADWAGHLRDQCRQSRVPFYLLHGSHKQRIPDNLFIREVPEWPSC